MDYDELGLKAGIEIHRRLNTKEKLFCSCENFITDKGHDMQITRNLRSVVGETGKFDVATKFEMQKTRDFIYNVYPEHVCLVDTDSEPPHPINRNAFETVLGICLMLNCEIPDEIHIMRKTIIDGSAVSGFQRTMLCGLNGWFELNGKKVRIAGVNLEEESSGIIYKDKNKASYRLDRQGIPLIEVSTGLLEGFTPEEIKKVAQKLGMILKSTGKVQSGLGSIRQDVNISIKKGTRVEIKGLQDLRLIPKIIDNEIERQLSSSKVEKQVRAAKPDGTTKFLRPLPGSARMYPETDLLPIKTDKKLLEELKDELPELIDDKIIRLSESGLSRELAKEIVNSKYFDLFNDEVKRGLEPRLVANVFINVLRDLEKREKLDTSKLTKNDFIELFNLLKSKKILKEAIPVVLKFRIEKPQYQIHESVKMLDLEVISDNELKRTIVKIIRENRGLPENRLIGLAMGKLRGKAEPERVIKFIKKKTL